VRFIFRITPTSLPGNQTMTLLVQHGAMRNGQLFCSFKLMKEQGYRPMEDIL
jgi:hypothetical protein